MSIIKDLTITIMYIYIFFVIFYNNNLVALSMMILFGIVLINLNLQIKNFDKKLKNQLNKQREFFINSLRHDLRTPIIAQIRILELINKENFGALNTMQKDILNQLEESSRCLFNLISLMINTYNIENQTFKLIYEKFNLYEIVLLSFNELQSQAKEKKITFEYRNSDKNVSITADKEEIKKVLLNLLSYALSRTSYGGNISVTTSINNHKIKLLITGDKNTFYSGTCFNTVYTSIGQNIRIGFCKKIIENHNGKILNNGTKNYLSLELPQVCT